MDVFVADGDPSDFDFATHTIDAKDKSHGGLLVAIDEAEGAVAIVPLRGEARGERLGFGCEFID